jgi:chromate reductase, NAD(P)H dehydrogenase (quinone)
MSQLTIAVIVGSLRRDSLNKKLAHAITKLAPPDFSFTYSQIGDLPLYNQDSDENQAAPVLRFKKEIEAANGILFVTAEYNRSVPGVLKNAIDNASRPDGKNSWVGKPAGVIGVSPGSAGTTTAQQHLRATLAAIGMPTLPSEAYIQAKDGLFDDSGNIGPGSKAFLQGWMDKYAAWIKLHAK